MKIASKGMYKPTQTSDRAGRVVSGRAKANYASSSVAKDEVLPLLPIKYEGQEVFNKEIHEGFNVGPFGNCN